MTASNSSTHAAVWAAIDAIASARGMSLSALSAAAGCPKATLNRSHRFTEHGKPSWPTMRTIARVLDAAGMDYRQFGDLVEAMRSTGPMRDGVKVAA